MKFTKMHGEISKTTAFLVISKSKLVISTVFSMKTGTEQGFL